MKTARQVANEVVAELIDAGLLILSGRERAIEIVEKVVADRDEEHGIEQADIE